MSELKQKTYPAALHMYEIHYSNRQFRVIHACGSTHAYAMSRECWPNDQITEVKQLDDSWKN